MAEPRRLGLATTNAGKLRDFEALLAPLGFVIDVAPKGFDVEETGTTFAANAQLKAEALMRITRAPCIADDSGLIIDALGGAPGLYSARYSGETNPSLRDAANNARVLRELTHVSGAERTARFVCAIAYVSATDAVQTFEAKLDGHITRAPSGEGGFGYDAIFVPKGQTQTMAELPLPIRYALSHRAQALKLLRAALSA